MSHGFVAGFRKCVPTSGCLEMRKQTASPKVHGISHRPNRAPNARHLQLGSLLSPLSRCCCWYSAPLSRYCCWHSSYHGIDSGRLPSKGTLRCLTVSGLSVHLPTGMFFALAKRACVKVRTEYRNEKKSYLSTATLFGTLDR